MTRTAMTEATKWVRRLEVGFLLCRGLRHQWNPEGGFRGVTSEERYKIRGTVGYAQIVTLELHCLRCGAIRTDVYGRTQQSKNNGGKFEKIRGRYTYPKGYALKVADLGERPASSEYYGEMYRRLS